MKALYCLSIIYMMQIANVYCQPVIVNPTFTNDASGWTDCISSSQPENFSESAYGGSTSDKVVEVDNGDALGLCQNISGFTVNQTYTLYIMVSRRTTTGQGGGQYAPSTVGLLIDIGDKTNVSVTMSNTTFGYVQYAITFKATATSLLLDVSPDPSTWAADPGSSDTYGMAIKGISLSPISFPVELLNFSAIRNGSKVDLDWQTATEKNNHYFVVEKSRNGIDFTAIDIVDGAGNSQSQLSYHASDPAPYAGTSYYRLKQTDYDGKFSYSKIVAVKNDGNVAIEIYPNPNQGSFRISVNSENKLYNIEITDLEGRLVYKGSGNPDNQVTEVSGLSKGIYVVRVLDGSIVTLRKLVVM
jgi:hypothetical protein